MPTNFQIPTSPDSVRLLYLASLREVQNVTNDSSTGKYVFAPPSTRAPMDDDAYFDLMDEYAQNYTEEEFNTLNAKLRPVGNPDRLRYGKLKQAFRAELQKQNLPYPNPNLVFDDATMRIDVGYGFKEFIDRFTTVMPEVRKVIAPDPNDKRPLQDIFRDDLAVPAVKQSANDHFGEVYKEYRDQGPAAFKDPATPVDVSGATTGAQGVAAVFANGTANSQEGMCLDDIHNSTPGPQFLKDNMQSLANSGVTTLFIEHLWQEYQGMLDTYMNGPANAVLDPALDVAVTKLDADVARGTGQPVTPFREMLTEAKARGVRIVGLDNFDSKVRADGDPRLPERRAANFNATAAEVVQREKGAGKYVLLAGSAHNNTHFDGFPGMAQILGVPAMKVAPGGKLEKSPETEKRGMRSEAEQAFYDAFIDRLYAAKKASFTTDGGAALYSDTARKAADQMARKLGPNLGKISPAQITAMATQAADRTVTALDNGTASLGGTDAVNLVTAAAESRSVAYDTEVKDLRQAISQGRTADAQRIINASTDPRLFLDATDPDTSLLHVAALKGNKALAETVMAKGGNPNYQNAQGDTPLHAAIEQLGGLQSPVIADTAAALVTGGARLDINNKQNATPANSVLVRIAQEGTGAATRMTQDGLAAIHTNFKTRPEYNAAKAPKNIRQYMAAATLGDVAAINGLPVNDPLLRAEVSGETLVHAAAKGQQLGVLQALKGKGANLKKKDSTGNSALHIVCKDGADHPNLVSYLINELSLNAADKNNMGKTPLHYAVVENQLGAVTAMVNNPLSGRFRAADDGGMTPLDWAVAKSNVTKAEQIFYQADPTLDPNGPPGGTPSTVDMLMWMTRAEKSDKYDDKIIRKLYEDLYNDPTLRPVMEVAARDGFGGRDTTKNPNGRQAMKIILANNHGSLGGGGQGNYMDTGNRLNFGGTQSYGEGGEGNWLDSVKGTLVHELTHHAAAVVYKNDGLPIPKGNPTGNDTAVEKKYVDAFADDVKTNSHLAVTNEEQMVVTYLSGRLQPYTDTLKLPGRTFSGKENMELELIVGVSQAIAQYGKPLVAKLYPKLTDYYEKDFAAACTHACANDPVLSANPLDTVKDIGNPLPDAPDKAFTPLTEVSVDSIWKKIKAEMTFGLSKPDPTWLPAANIGAPVYDSSNLRLDDNDKALLDRRETFVKKLIQKTLDSKGMPSQLSTENIRELAKGIGQECLKGTSDKDFANAALASTQQFAKKAPVDFESDFLDSSRKALNRKVDKKYTLSTREIADLILIRAADQAAGGTAQSMNPEKYEELASLLEKNIEKLSKDELAKVQKDPMAYAAPRITALVNHKDFKVKSKNKGTGHISIEKKPFRRAWLQKLAKVK